MRLRTWKASPDAYPMLMLYPPLDKHAVQVTIWRRKFELRW